HPRFLAFIPSAPSEASVLFDLVVAASSLYGGSWLESAGAVYAENQALSWLVGLAGLPEAAGGAFVSGGTAGNLSALVAARSAAAEKREHRPRRWALLATGRSHSSIQAAADVMDVDVVLVEPDEHGRMTGSALGRRLDELDEEQRDGLFAVVTTAGTTNLGVIDDLETIGFLAKTNDLWMHVDGAYGGAALAAPSRRQLFNGIEHADSIVLDPHKWLFAPFDCAALIYREPEVARRAHTQHAGYLDPINDRDEWNPSDYAHHLSRRARGLPFWYSLATYGTDAYRDAIEKTLRVAEEAARAVADRSYVELLEEPTLSIVAFRRLGWQPADYQAWSERMLAEGIAFVLPSVFEGETMLRLAIVNPATTIEDIELILDQLA
ncbi:MAG: aminotransferase class V-fold PLP-dependent enzyme, partial [Acidimicrobiia bacterium]|nr:aminotransferase class V-fold PLP-dependent enzyme [Acidimicrobiia bacterium]